MQINSNEELKEACLNVLREYNIRLKFYGLINDMIEDSDTFDLTEKYNKFKQIAEIVKKSHLC